MECGSCARGFREYKPDSTLSLLILSLKATDIRVLCLCSWLRGESPTLPAAFALVPSSGRERATRSRVDPSGAPVMFIYRYWSGIYHFFDSFGKCGKISGIGMVLIFDCKQPSMSLLQSTSISIL